MMNRRGFLGAMLAAAAAPAIVRASSLMPVKAPAIIAPPQGIYTGELGVIETFRFVEMRELPRNKGDTIRFRRHLPFAPAPTLTLAALQRMVSSMEKQAVPQRELYFVHPNWAADLRAEGVPVAPVGWVPPEEYGRR